MLPIVINILQVVLVLVSLLIILLVLMQRPKNEGLGAAFGGGATDQLFGAQTTNVLQTITRWLGGIFFVLTLVLSILYVKKGGGHSSLQEKLTAPTVIPTLPTPPTAESGTLPAAHGADGKPGLTPGTGADEKPSLAPEGILETPAIDGKKPMINLEQPIPAPEGAVSEPVTPGAPAPDSAKLPGKGPAAPAKPDSAPAPEKAPATPPVTTPGDEKATPSAPPVPPSAENKPAESAPAPAPESKPAEPAK